jgi:hypothetical protein
VMVLPSRTHPERACSCSEGREGSEEVSLTCGVRADDHVVVLEVDAGFLRSERKEVAKDDRIEFQRVVSWVIRAAVYGLVLP